jgi:hypothetical protein
MGLNVEPSRTKPWKRILVGAFPFSWLTPGMDKILIKSNIVKIRNIYL